MMRLAAVALAALLWLAGAPAVAVAAVILVAPHLTRDVPEEAPQ